MSFLWSVSLFLQLGTVLVVKLSVESVGVHSAGVAVTGGISTVVRWRKNTNFANPENWDGLVGNCSGNIFSFPAYMDLSVVALPSSILAKQIILPVNGHFVFQPGRTTLSDSGTCQGSEVKFRRTFRADWFDADNWIGNDSLLSSKAIPHVERVPCQYDSVQFPSKSSFNLLISSDVAIRKFFLGDQEENYTAVAVLMNSQLGKLQFEKAAETQFHMGGKECLETNNDQKTCICNNYNEPIHSKICSLSAEKCKSVMECPNPMMPHGFCCSICGFHIKIQHTKTFKIVEMKHRLASLVGDQSSKYPMDVHISRYAEENSHVIFVPANMNSTLFAHKIVDEFRIYLKSYPRVVDVTVGKSWTAEQDDKWVSSGLNGGVITLIVFIIIILLGGIAFFIFRNKGNPLPTFASCISRLPNIPFPGRDVLGSSHSFAFARFSNERVSSVNIGQSTIQRAEEVDENPPMDIDMPKITDASAGFGFSNVTYDIIAVGDEPGNAEKVNNDAAGTSFTTTTIPSSTNTKATSGNANGSTKEILNGKEGNGNPGSSSSSSSFSPFDAMPLFGADEPIYDDVLEVNEGTSAILQDTSTIKLFEE